MAAKRKRELISKENGPDHEYELVFIVNPEVVEEALENTINGVSQFVTSKGGTVSQVEQWGKRKLAYPLKRFLEGNYVLARFKMRPQWSKELESNLQISENILRHLLVKIGD